MASTDATSGLDRLRKPDGSVPAGAGWYNAALDDVRTWMQNPSDTDVDALAVAANGYLEVIADDELAWSRLNGVERDDMREMVRAVLAAAARTTSE